MAILRRTAPGTERAGKPVHLKAAHRTTMLKALADPRRFQLLLA